jgi:hypothetical protein
MFEKIVLELMEEDAGGISIMMSLIICTLHKPFLG